MKAVVLAAGYATRLYPLTKDKPKAFLPIGGKAILDYVIEEIESIKAIDHIYLVSNHKFYDQFKDWYANKNLSVPLTILDDNTGEDSHKLGAVGDLQFAVEKASIDDDILVIASDNLFTFKLYDMWKEFERLDKDLLCVKKMDNIDDLRRMAVITLDEDKKILHLEEKPQNPKDNFAAFAIYMYKKDTLPLISKFMDEGNNPEAPGHFPEWLYTKKPVYCFIFEGECIDIGTVDSYGKACREYEKFL